MAGNTSFDAILSTTLKNYRATLEDNVFNQRALTNWLKSKGRIETWSGGPTIVVPLIFGENSTAGSYSGYDTLPTTPQEGISAAEYTPKEAAVSIAISGFEEAVNDGPQQVIDLLESKVMQAEESFNEYLNATFFSDGTGNSSKDMQGLKNIVASATSDAAAYKTLGGIDSSVSGNEFWQSYVEATTTPLTLGILSTMQNGISQGTNKTPDFHITTSTLWEKYEGLLVPAQRFSDSKTAEAGFTNLLYKAAPVTFDIDCTSGTWYALNSKYIKLKRHSKVWFSQTPFMRPTNQNARYAQIICMGQLVTPQRRRLGKLQNKS